MRTEKIDIHLHILTRSEIQDPALLGLFEACKAACKNAYAPYSGFRVGAAVLMENGEIVIGNNQENAAYPSGLCAERVAVFQAGALFPDTPIKAIAITIDYEKFPTQNWVFPCGSCRQSLVEYERRYDHSIKVYLLGKNGEIAYVDDVASLLPFVFSGDALQNKSEENF
ncbi:MAG: cytidine deaminase [Chitinophagales bacterium]|nr:cytidine deaminase [Bacteroidota bacterium]MCB9044428.1 cytidine deaminase [Chitinophagales bacterium]